MKLQSISQAADLSQAAPDEKAAAGRAKCERRR